MNTLQTISLMLGVTLSSITLATLFFKILIKLHTLNETIMKANAEQKIICKGLLACLEGLGEMGCNGPVTKATTELKEYLITK